MSVFSSTRLGLALGALGVLLPASAFADTPDCDSISGGAPIIYGAGGSGPRDVVGALAVQLESGDDPVFVVYKDDGGSCSGAYALTGLADPTITGSAVYWPAETGSKTTCNLPLAGATVDFAFLDVQATNCPSIGGDASLLDGLVHVSGAADPVAVLVPVGSTQQAISSEAFYLVYGFGAAAGIEPWTNADDSYFQRRNDDSGTQAMVSLASTLPTTAYIGTDAGGGSTLVSNLSSLAEPEQGIGFATSATADAHRDVVRNLAWKQAGQDVAYYPDSDATSFDKRNVREGRYNVWANISFYAVEGSSSGSYANPDAKVLGEYFGGGSQPAGVTSTIAETVIPKGVIPMCAMHVQRDEDMGPLYAYDDPAPCDCYFDAATTGATTCETCDDSNPCSTGTCRLGYCEAN